MGYRGKLTEQREARRLRAHGMAMTEIAEKLGVSKSSVSLWTRDVDVPRAARRRLRSGTTNKLHLAKLAEIEECNAGGVERMAQLSEQAFLAAGAALYAGEGSKTDGKVTFANTNADMVAFFCRWLRTFFDIDEARLRARVYLHQGLDLDVAEEHWSHVTGIPRTQFRRPYRAVPDPSIRVTKHECGCVYVNYYSSRVHRSIMGLVRGLLASEHLPG